MNETIVVRYQDQMKDQWNDFVSKAKNGLFLFDRNFMDYHRDRFKDHSLVFCRDEKIIALLPANEKDNVLVSHGGLTYGGFLFDNEVKQHTANECVDVLLNYSKGQNFQKIIYKPVPHMFHKQAAEEDLYAIFQRGGTLKEMYTSSVVNLRTPIKMLKGRRAQSNRAKREGVKITLLESKEDYRKFIDLENSVLESRHNAIATHTAEELFLLHCNFPQQIRLYGALYEGELIAGAVVFVYDEAVHTQYLAANETARVIGALDYTVSTLISEFEKTKILFDFGNSTEDHGRYLNEGLIYQKEGFGGRTNIYTTWEISL